MRTVIGVAALGGVAIWGYFVTARDSRLDEAPGRLHVVRYFMRRLAALPRSIWTAIVEALASPPRSGALFVLALGVCAMWLGAIPGIATIASGPDRVRATTATSGWLLVVVGVSLAFVHHFSPEHDGRAA